MPKFSRIVNGQRKAWEPKSALTSTVLLGTCPAQLLKPGGTTPEALKMQEAYDRSPNVIKRSSPMGQPISKIFLTDICLRSQLAASLDELIWLCDKRLTFIKLVKELSAERPISNIRAVSPSLWNKHSSFMIGLYQYIRTGEFQSERAPRLGVQIYAINGDDNISICTLYRSLRFEDNLVLRNQKIEHRKTTHSKKLVGFCSEGGLSPIIVLINMIERLTRNDTATLTYDPSNSFSQITVPVPKPQFFSTAVKGKVGAGIESFCGRTAELWKFNRYVGNDIIDLLLWMSTWPQFMKQVRDTGALSILPHHCGGMAVPWTIGAGWIDSEVLPWHAAWLFQLSSGIHSDEILGIIHNKLIGGQDKILAALSVILGNVSEKITLLPREDVLTFCSELASSSSAKRSNAHSEKLLARRRFMSITSANRNRDLSRQARDNISGKAAITRSPADNSRLVRTRVFRRINVKDTGDLPEPFNIATASGNSLYLSRELAETVFPKTFTISTDRRICTGQSIKLFTKAESLGARLDNEMLLSYISSLEQQENIEIEANREHMIWADQDSE